MKAISIFFVGLIAFLGFGFAAFGQGQKIGLTEGPKASDTLKSEILTADKALFDAVFVTCDMSSLSKMLTKDVKFIHDKWGQIAQNRAEMLKTFGASCDRQKAGTDFKARRELIPETVQIHALNKYGAIEIGKHNFFAVQSDGTLKETESGEFIILWKKENNAWKMAETISYNHILAN